VHTWPSHSSMTSCGKSSSRCSRPRSPAGCATPAASPSTPHGAHRHRLRAQDRRPLGAHPGCRDGRLSGVSCWRKLREWQAAGVWDRLVEVLLARLHQAEKINWEPAAVHGGRKTRPSPVDRRKAGSKHNILVDDGGVPLAGRVTKANRNEVTQLEKLVDEVPPVRGKPGRPRQRPDELDAGEICSVYARRWGVETTIKELKSGLHFGQMQVTKKPERVKRSIALPVLAYITVVWIYGRTPTTVQAFSLFQLKRRFAEDIVREHAERTESRWRQRLEKAKCAA
jgi:hypothetical protein